MENKQKKSGFGLGKIMTYMMIITLIFSLVNTVQLVQANIQHKDHLSMMMSKSQGSLLFNSIGSSISDTNNIMPHGIPAIYGAELGVSFDDVSAQNPQKADATIKKLGELDRSLTLSGNDLERYIDIGMNISCEYCCGAQAVIFQNGQAACSCAHSFAMRGLAKYLITEHGNEYTNDQILEEMGKWKTLFFPGPMTAKAKALSEKGIELNYINLASNKYRGIEKGLQAAADGSGMVGGC
ncbi:MAG: hypothetical protein QS98_C0004G0004 [archaeon GW2011_AR3]|nr:MAG: hypothetical protein QS98_C0004G0004 [archaeon GW2011_AR3]MBS3109557.1 hypothetical protein [Candidatus Woesearchaeota archaeon]